MSLRPVSDDDLGIPRQWLTLGQYAYALYFGGDVDWDRWPAILESFDQLALDLIAEHERRQRPDVCSGCGWVNSWRDSGDRGAAWDDHRRSCPGGES